MELRQLLTSCFNYEPPTRPRFFGAGESDARTPIRGLAFRLARLRDAAAGEAGAAMEDGAAAQQSTLDDIKDAIEAAGRWGDETESSDAFGCSAAAAAAPPTLRSQASAELSAHAYLKPLKFGAAKLALYVAAFDAEGYEREEELRDYVMEAHKTAADLVAEFKMSDGHARRLIKHLRGAAAPPGAPAPAAGASAAAAPRTMAGGGGASGGGGGASSAPATRAAAPAPPRAVATPAEIKAFWATDMTDMTHVVVPYGVTEIPKLAFNGFGRLVSAVLPVTVTTIGDYAFYKCSSLAAFVVPDSVTTIGVQAFACCSSLTTASLPSGATLGDNVFLNSPTTVTTRR